MSPDAAAPQLLRGAIFHTPRNPFTTGSALVSHPDGALVIAQGCIAACGPWSELAAAYPDAIVHDHRGSCILPGFVDTHTHYPQARILGGLGYSLPEWLERIALPEEARLSDPAYAAPVAREFLRGLAANGTTTALVFGSHFPAAMAGFFAEAHTSGLRIIAGLVLADRRLRPELHQTPDAAWRDSQSLIQRFHGHGRLAFAVTPRFALSASEAMLDVCRALLAGHRGLRFTTHINENVREIGDVDRAFPWATDYLAVYEEFGLVGRRSVLAHNVHASACELSRIAASGASIAHCPSSNAALGSGIFPLRRHLEAGVHCALGTDVGAGTGFGILKEGLQAYLAQRLAPEPMTLTPAQLLWLATGAGAEALGMQSEIGDFTPGKSADLVILRPPARSPLEAALSHAESPERMLTALFTLAGSESVQQVRVQGGVVYEI